MDKIQWLEYLNKKIDQEILYSRNNGISKWALILLIITISGSLFNEIRSLLITNIFAEWGLAITVIVANISFFIFILLRAFPKFKITDNKHQMNSIYHTYIEIKLSILMSLLLSILAISNMVFVFTFKFKLNSMPYYVASCYYFLNVAVLIGLFKRRYSYAKDGVDLPKLNDLLEMASENNMSKLMRFVTYVIIILLSISILFSCSFNGTTNQLFSLLSFSIKVISIICLFIFLKGIDYGDSKISKLRSFEEKVLMNEINEKDIHQKFQAEFSGVSIEDWIGNVRESISQVKVQLEEMSQLGSEKCNKDCDNCSLDNEIKSLQVNVNHLKHINKQVRYVRTVRRFYGKFSILEIAFDELGEVIDLAESRIHSMRRIINPQCIS